MHEFIPISKEPDIVFTGEKIKLLNNIEEKIESHWNELIKNGKNFTRGDVFTIAGIESNENNFQVKISLSDYAHYLATIHGLLDEKYACRVVHTSVMIETADNMLVFGEMNSNTALPGRIQCIGGGITRKDLSVDGVHFNMRGNAAMEMAEEVGLSADNSKQVNEFFPWAIVESGPQKFLGVVYWAKLSMDLEKFIDHYAKFEKSLLEKGDQPELSRIAYVSKLEENKESCLNQKGNPFAEYLPIIFDNISYDD